jgi:hypothetical protein
MGFFRRAKSFKKKPAGFARHENTTVKGCSSHETIGEPLSPKDQFYLEVPSRQPVSILRRMNSDEVMRKRRCRYSKSKSQKPRYNSQQEDDD